MTQRRCSALQSKEKIVHLLIDRVFMLRRLNKKSVVMYLHVCVNKQ
jgi:hypothetical protein